MKLTGDQINFRIRAAESEARFKRDKINREKKYIKFCLSNSRFTIRHLRFPIPIKMHISGHNKCKMVQGMTVVSRKGKSAFSVCIVGESFCKRIGLYQALSRLNNCNGVRLITISAFDRNISYFLTRMGVNNN